MIRIRRWLLSRAPGLCAALLGIFMMIYGLWRGEGEIVLAKAIRICMECIGIV